MSIVSEAQETFIEYSAKEYNIHLVDTDDMHDMPGQSPSFLKKKMLSLCFADNPWVNFTAVSPFLKQYYSQI